MFDDNYTTANYLAKRLGIPESTVLTDITLGIIPPDKVFESEGFRNKENVTCIEIEAAREYEQFLNDWITITELSKYTPWDGAKIREDLMLGLIPETEVKVFSCDCHADKFFIRRSYIPEYLSTIKLIRKQRNLEREQFQKENPISPDDIMEPPDGVKKWIPNPEYVGFELLPEEFERLYKIRTRHGLNKLNHNKEALEKILGKKL